MTCKKYMDELVTVLGKYSEDGEMNSFKDFLESMNIYLVYMFMLHETSNLY